MKTTTQVTKPAFDVNAQTAFVVVYYGQQQALKFPLFGMKKTTQQSDDNKIGVESAKQQRQ